MNKIINMYKFIQLIKFLHRRKYSMEKHIKTSTLKQSYLQSKYAHNYLEFYRKLQRYTHTQRI